MISSFGGCNEIRYNKFLHHADFATDSTDVTFPDFSSADRSNASDFSGGTSQDTIPAARSLATSSSASYDRGSPQHHNTIEGTVATGGCFYHRKILFVVDYLPIPQSQNARALVIYIFRTAKTEPAVVLSKLLQEAI